MATDVSTLPKYPADVQINRAIQNLFEQAQTISRAMLSSRLGTQFGGERDLYKTFGYVYQPQYQDFKNLFDRQGLANRMVSKLPKDVWNTPPVILDGESRSDQIDDQATEFIKKFVELAERLPIWSAFRDADIMCGYSRYSVIVLGAAGQDLSTPAGNGILAFMQPFDEKQAVIDSYIADSKSPLFGMPEFYNVTWNDPVTGGPIFEVSGGNRVHHTRVIHIAHDRLGSRVFGTPGLQTIINRLFDLEKVTGGGAEAAWLSVYKGILLTAKEGADLPATGSAEAELLKSNLMDFINQIQRVAVLDNVDVNDLGVQTVDIRSIFDVLIEDLCGSKGFPQRILLGSERGELASSQDMREWNGVVTSERTNQSEPVSLKPFINWCIAHKILPAPSSGRFTFQWADVYPETKKEKADRALVLAQGASAITGGVPEEALDINEFRTINDLPPRTEEELEEFEDEADEKLRQEAEKKGEFTTTTEEEEEDEDDRVRENGIRAGAVNFLRRLFPNAFEDHRGRPGKVGGSLPRSAGTGPTPKKQLPLFSREKMESLTVEVPTRLDEDVNVDEDAEATWEVLREESGAYHDSLPEFTKSAYEYRDEESGIYTDIVQIKSYGHEIKVKGKVFNKDGGQIGEFTRTMDSSGLVTHDYFRIDDEYVGTGFGIKFFKNSEDVYRQNGISGISVHANINVGGYAWAKVGFEWDDRQTDGMVMTENFYDLWRDRYGEDSLDMLPEIALNYDEGGVKELLQPYEIAAIEGYDGFPIGKAYLLNTNHPNEKKYTGSSLDWYGIKPLYDDDHPAMQISEAYYKAKGIK